MTLDFYIGNYEYCLGQVLILSHLGPWTLWVLGMLRTLVTCTAPYDVGIAGNSNFEQLRLRTQHFPNISLRINGVETLVIKMIKLFFVFLSRGFCRPLLIKLLLLRSRSIQAGIPARITLSLSKSAVGAALLSLLVSVCRLTCRLTTCGVSDSEGFRCIQHVLCVR